MGQKVNCNPQKLASIIAYLQRSRTVHSIKDLEKHLPSVASINGMQVKDYIQHLQDENKIRMEKIGSGNWYWSFASEEKKTRQDALAKAQAAHEKATSVVQDLKKRLAEAEAQREDEAQMLEGGAQSREQLTAIKLALDKDIKECEKELAAYRDTDPTELERKEEEMKKFKVEVEQYTDEIYLMESWLGKRYGEGTVKELRLPLYGDELDEEEGILREM